MERDLDVFLGLVDEATRHGWLRLLPRLLRRPIVSFWAVWFLWPHILVRAE